MNYEKTLETLCELAAPSGYEQQAAQVALELLKPLVDEAFLDRMGNVVGVRRCGKPEAKKLLLDAHLDEIGFLVTGHEEGFLRFTTVGGVDPRMLPDREVLLMTQPPVVGVVTCLPPHVQNSEEFDNAIPVKELYIDVGLSQEEAQNRIPIGTPAVYHTSCQALGEQLLCGKAMDDRASFAVLLDVAERLQGKELDVDVYFLGSTQEETHSTGAMTATYGMIPDACIAIDVTHGDSPDASKDKTFPLGKGTVIGMGPNCAKWLVNRLKATAEQEQIPYQLEVMAGSSGTNGWVMQVVREGIATGVLSIPLRYMHTPVETVHRGDLEETAKLLTAFVLGVGKEPLC